MLESSPAMVIGLDLSHHMLRQSQQKNRASDPKPQHIQGDAVRLPFSSAVFDAVFMSFTLELFSEADISAVLDECSRVLTSRGRLGVVALAGTPRTLPVRLYELVHRLFPVAVDCRPIPLVDMLRSNGFETITAKKERNWGLPIHLTLSTKHSGELNHNFKEHNIKNA
jgi:ubiquinone/menaquinone biosynthesis C-methylase UbiE